MNVRPINESRLVVLQVGGKSYVGLAQPGPLGAGEYLAADDDGFVLLEDAYLVRDFAIPTGAGNISLLEKLVFMDASARTVSIRLRPTGWYDATESQKKLYEEQKKIDRAASAGIELAAPRPPRGFSS